MIFLALVFTHTRTHRETHPSHMKYNLEKIYFKMLFISLKKSMGFKIM